MSDFGAVPAAILVVVDGAITLGGSRDGFISYERIGPDEFPYAMIHSPVKERDRSGILQHGVETTANVLVVVWKSQTIATVNADVVTIEAALNASTLSGIVEDTWCAAIGRDEGLDSEHTAAIFQVNTRGSV
jgi:hypothetical protein